MSSEHCNIAVNAKRKVNVENEKPFTALRADIHEWTVMDYAAVWHNSGVGEATRIL